MSQHFYLFSLHCIVGICKPFYNYSRFLGISIKLTIAKLKKKGNLVCSKFVTTKQLLYKHCRTQVCASIEKKKLANWHVRPTKKSLKGVTHDTVEHRLTVNSLNGYLVTKAIFCPDETPVHFILRKTCNATTPLIRQTAKSQSVYSLLQCYPSPVLILYVAIEEKHWSRANFLTGNGIK